MIADAPQVEFRMPSAPLANEVAPAAPLEAQETPTVSFRMPPRPPPRPPPPPPAPAAPSRSSAPYRAMAERVIRANEGVKNQVYYDTKNLPTVGIGHLLSKRDVARYAGRQLSNDEIEQLFARDLDTKEAAARSRLGNDVFERMPDELKASVLDGFFRGDLSGSPKTIELLKAGKYTKAADEYLNNLEYKASVALNRSGKAHGVAGRMERNAAVMRAAGRKLSKP
jgi:GH24 family phage-related lysozyme (muramidase)